MFDEICMIFKGFRGIAGTSTAFPSGLTAGATWDRDLVRQWGISMGIEFFAKGANVQLGPGVCVARVPKNGRNFECKLVYKYNKKRKRVLVHPVMKKC